MIKVVSPSNIAIVKYWGKHGRQLPRNASVSFTLSNAVSETTMMFSPKAGPKRNIHFNLDGIEKISFAEKIDRYFDSITDYMPFLADYDFHFESHNTFPHSSGIASSASGMSAVAMALCEMQRRLENKEELDLQRVSLLSRLGSGSACRSVFPDMAVWGKHQDWEGSSDEYAICISHHLHDVFKDYHDDILIVSDREKSVSSTAGHGLMESNPYAPTRYAQANDNMKRLKSILASGDVEAFGQLAEREALTLHALMMSSDPSFLLIQPATVVVIQKLREYRQETGLPLYFTLDAGPNVHLLYPDAVAEKASAFIISELMPLVENGRLLPDQVGKGAVIVS
ncbi:MAG TPA: diphosphomevalonate decarboxylase [Saprospiraceae bacterium]|nr:diphosphomevalonate decarboxylase [Saprospiraceae bacterium]HRG20111.1 diphosphomevalonate decarboxylase [Saprospiraceae bacterium]